MTDAEKDKLLSAIRTLVDLGFVVCDVYIPDKSTPNPEVKGFMFAIDDESLIGMAKSILAERDE